MNKIFKALQLVHRRKIAIFSLLTRCNCQCKMCSIWGQEPYEIPLLQAKNLLDSLKSMNVGFVQFTGGEPLLHSNLMEILHCASKLRFFAFLNTNGTALTNDNCKHLKAAGVDVVTVSLDHFKPEIVENIRHHKGILTKILAGIANLKEQRIKVISSMTPTIHNYNDVEEIIQFTNDLGVPFGFAYPVDAGEYFHIGAGKETFLNNEQLREVILTIWRLKKAGYSVINSQAYMTECLRFLTEKPPLTNCLAGREIFYVDHFGGIHACFHKHRVNHPCNECMLECFREPSIFLQNKIAFIREFWGELR